MANVISDETIEYVGILAKLELNTGRAGACQKGYGRNVRLYRQAE